MPFIGYGLAPLGSSQFGSGEELEVVLPPPGVFSSKLDGARFGGRAIDPVTRKYVLGDHGRVLGMPKTKQRVQLAVMTVSDSSAQLGLGLALKVRRFGGSWKADVRDAYTQALASLVEEGAIEILSITPERVGSNGALVATRWRDLATQEVVSTSSRIG